MKQVNLYSDGACSGNPGPGAWCTILEHNGTEKVFQGTSEYTTNNIMELSGVIEGIKLLKVPCQVTIYSDSQYVVKGISEWMQNWIKKDFRGIANSDLWKEYLRVSDIHKISTVWVKGHSGDIYNERCNKIAQQLAQDLKLKINK